MNTKQIIAMIEKDRQDTHEKYISCADILMYTKVEFKNQLVAIDRILKQIKEMR